MSEVTTHQKTKKQSEASEPVVLSERDLDAIAGAAAEFSTTDDARAQRAEVHDGNIVVTGAGDFLAWE